jgi:hypothetical protein
VSAVFDFLERYQTSLLWGSGVLLVAGLLLDVLRQAADTDDRDPEKPRD